MKRFLGLRGARLTSAISATCGLCFLCYGYAQGVLGGLLTVSAFIDRFPQVDIVHNSSFHNAWVAGFTVGAWNLGCVISSVLAVFVCDILGRRKTLLIGLTIWIIGEIIQASSYSFAQFIVGRAIAGFGNGLNTSTTPAYQAECVKSHRKGTILMISAGAFVSFGLALSYWLVFGFAYIGGSSAAWRVPIAFQIVFALTAIGMLLVLPESPRWLILTGREQEALVVLAALNDADVDDFETKDEFLQIKDAILIMAQGNASSMFSNKERRSFHRVVLANLVQVFQQGTGINLVLQYLSWIFLTRLSYSAWLSRLLASCSATTYFLASFVTVVGIDRFWGRRSLMLFGASGMSGCMVLLTITHYLWQDHGINGARFASTVFLFAFSMFFAIGWQGMAWLVSVEVVPLRVRGPANALSSFSNWVLNFIIVFITPIAFTRISYRTWIILAATNFAIIPLVYFFYPETAFRSLEEVDVIFALADDMPGNPWLNVVKISKSEPLWFKRGEKGTGFNYANSSWHRRLLESKATESSSSGSGNEKYSYGTTSSGTKRPGSSGSDTDIPAMPLRARRSESLIDPRLDASPTSTITTTIHSNPEKKRSRLRKKSSRTLNESVSSEQPIVGLDKASPPLPEHSRQRSNSGGSIHSVRPEWWTEELAPAPLSVRSRASSLDRNGRPGTADTHASFANNALAATHYVDSHVMDVESPGRESYHARSVDYREDARSVLGHAGRVSDGLTRTTSGRDTYFPDGLDRGEISRPVSRASNRRYSAREAGKGA